LDDGGEETESVEEFLELDGHVALHQEIVAGNAGLRIGALWM
jgi:hypothetical protein